MELNEIEAEAQDHDRGRDFDLLDPVTGKGLGITLRIAGPDSATQARARLRMMDELAEAAEPVPFTHGNVLRLLRAAPWVQAQVDSFAADRAAFRGLR